MEEENLTPEAQPKTKPKWYFKTSTVLVSFLFLGPFMLPLVWLNPNYSSSRKVFVTFAVLVLTVVLLRLCMQSAENIIDYYKVLEDIY